jgi:3-hydroxy-9,10-secoandrosta-1,3,5(10)-triene-9,17-dione monooxygenase
MPDTIQPVPVFAVGASPTALRAELVGRAREVASVLVGNAERTERDRRVAEENIVAIRQAGLSRLLVPRRFGGLEADFRTQLEVTRELAKGCGSTAWVFSLGNFAAWIAGLGSDRLQKDVWESDPHARFSGGLAGTSESRTVDGGIIVSGKWAWATGCFHATWATLGVPDVDAAGQVVGHSLAFVPMNQVSIEETWFMAGMRGTGSNTIVAHEVFVPSHRLISVSDLLGGDCPTPHRDEALYHSAFGPAAITGLIGPQLGLAARALELVLENAPKRGIANTIYASRTMAPTVQLAVARAATLIDTAQLHAYRMADSIDNAARTGAPLSYLERARARMDGGHVVHTCREAIRILCSANGASSFAESNPLQRIWRDCEVAGNHAAANPDINAEIYGRALLGVTERVTPLI